MRLVVDGLAVRGTALDLPGLDPEAVLVAVRASGAPGRETTPPLDVACASPGPGHGRLARVGWGRPPSPRASLAAAARSLGHGAPQDADLAAVRAELAASDPPAADGDAEDDAPDRTDPVAVAADLDAARERVAQAGGEVARLRERVATLRGRLLERRDERGDDGRGEASVGRPREDGTTVADAEAALAAAVGELSEVETERVAAEQALARVERRARSVRSARERRLRLEDRAANLRRAARAHLASLVADDCATALRSVPDADSGDGLTVDDASPADVHLAALRLAALDAPVVLAGAAADRFASAREACEVLATPVIRV